MTFKIRPATTTDLEQMYEISMRAHQDNYADLIPKHRRNDFDRHYTITSAGKERYITTMQQRLDDSEWFIWVAVDGDTVLGYTLAQKINDQLVHKKGLFMNPAYQGQGIGSALFNSSLELIDSGEIFLTVIENNKRARHVYEKHGFEVVGPDPKSFYGAPQVIMKLIKD